jgi:hypothetical protein
VDVKYNYKLFLIIFQGVFLQFQLSPMNITKVTCNNNYQRILIQLEDGCGTTVNIRDGDVEGMKAFHECVMKIKEGKSITAPGE